jgi:hypothetical protein
MLERNFNIEGQVSEIFEVDLYEFRSHLISIWRFVGNMIEGVKSGKYTKEEIAEIFEDIYNMMEKLDDIYLLLLEKKARFRPDNDALHNFLKQLGEMYLDRIKAIAREERNRYLGNPNPYINKAYKALLEISDLLEEAESKLMWAIDKGLFR